ncbi:hypothetical protein CsatB_023026 [Cannabis sativa]
MGSGTDIFFSAPERKEYGGNYEVFFKEFVVQKFLVSVKLNCYNGIYFYSYLLALVTTINNGEMYFNKLGALFEDVIALLSKFPGAVLSHVARSENLAAHGLAKHALRLDDELSWFEEVPAPVADVCVVNS